ncbi:hypothetical protein LPTSP3_g23230 [Leptospira kobayashii]|uniref:ABC-2 type transporter transmembrane domain-containing protein n=1 Tax=Leptospira kobayashii TaxID=1917830 RepID=A0ABM7UKN3_9LEPT|nr:hypothetical protein LPTSP3_g23230 [Leptospira kobayashii]
MYLEKSENKPTYKNQVILDSIVNRLKESQKKEIQIIPILSQKELDTKLKEGKILLGIGISIEEDSIKNKFPKIKIEILTSDNNTKEQYLSLELKSKLLDLFSTETELPFSIQIKNNGEMFIRSDFEQFIPGLLVFSIIMLIFSSSMMMTAEIESETYLRYKMSNTPVFSVLIGSSFLQLFNGIISILLSLSIAKLLGYQFHDKLILVFLICFLGSISCIGTGLLIASFMKTSQQAFLTSSFIMFLFLLFSGIIFPKPILLFRITEGFGFDVFYLLPTSLMKSALDRLLVWDKGLNSILFELSVLSALSLFYYLLGYFSYKNFLFDKSGRSSE